MIPIIKSDNTKAVLRNKKGGDVGAANVKAVLDEQIAVTGYTLTQEVRGDSNYDLRTSGTYYNTGFVEVDGDINEPLFTSETPDIATIDSLGYLTRVSSGIASIHVRVNGVVVPIMVDMQTKNAPVDDWAFLSTDPASLAYQASQQIDDLINAGMTLEANGGLFSTQDHTTPTYVRNTAFWGSGIDMTCISPWNSPYGDLRAGTLVTPRHIIGAAHYELSIGNTVRFITAGNQVIDRTITGIKQHPDYAPFIKDMTIYTLSSDVVGIPLSLFFGWRF